MNVDNFAGFVLLKFQSHSVQGLWVLQTRRLSFYDQRSLLLREISEGLAQHNGPVATLPSLAKCVGCHRNVQVTSDEGQASVDVLMQHWDEGVPLRWEKTYEQPDFVYFTHRPHIAAGVNCEDCHGDPHK